VIYEPRKKEKTRDERIKDEISRLKKIFQNIDDDNKALVDGLIQRAAYMRITLEDWEKDIMENGHIELFSQSDKLEPYERERPVARLYNTMNKNYQSIMKQLKDMLPTESESTHEAEASEQIMEYATGQK
jgi:hypothetical protein